MNITATILLRHKLDKNLLMLAEKNIPFKSLPSVNTYVAQLNLNLKENSPLEFASCKIKTV